MRTEVIKFLQHIDQAEETGYQLADDGGKTCIDVFHAKDDNKHKIQNYIKERSKDQKQERRFVVTHCRRMLEVTL